MMRLQREGRIHRPSRSRGPGAGGGGGGGTELSPSVTPTLWMSATDESTIVDTAGVVATWTCKGISGYEFVDVGTVNTGMQTINSLNCISLNTSLMNGPTVDTLLDLNSTDMTVLAVASFDNVSDYNCIIGKARAGTNNNRWALNRDFTPDNGPFVIADVGASSVASFADGASIGTPGLYGMEIELGSEIRAFYNSTTAGSSAALGAASATAYADLVKIGGWTNTSQWTMDGAIGEIMIFRQILTAPQKAEIFGALATKWGLTLV